MEIAVQVYLPSQMHYNKATLIFTGAVKHAHFYAMLIHDGI